MDCSLPPFSSTLPCVFRDVDGDASFYPGLGNPTHSMSLSYPCMWIVGRRLHTELAQACLMLSSGRLFSVFFLLTGSLLWLSSGFFLLIGSLLHSLSDWLCSWVIYLSLIFLGIRNLLGFEFLSKHWLFTCYIPSSSIWSILYFFYSFFDLWAIQ